MEKNNCTNDTRIALSAIAKLFLKLGFIGFGGPAVHIALMEKEVVKKRAWMSAEHFLDLVGATNLIPGPNSTEMAMHIGQEKAGWKGLLVAGCCFIVPAVLITAGFAWLYQQYGQLPQVQPFLYGIQPAIIAVIVALMVNLGRKALKSVELGVIGALAGIAVLAGFHEVYVLFAGGLCGMVLHTLKRTASSIKGIAPFIPLQIAYTIAQPGATKLFLLFLKIGAILYGSGYVLFAFLDAELVAKGWLTKQQLADAIAVGQFTPGPVFSSATFIGWQIAGARGAIAATIGIFLPSFVFVAALNPLLPRLRRSALMRAFLDTVNMVSVAIILSVVVEISRVSLTNWRAGVIALLSFIITFRFKQLNTAFIIVGGALLGYILWLL